jgi:arginase family enzyme
LAHTFAGSHRPPGRGRLRLFAGPNRGQSEDDLCRRAGHAAISVSWGDADPVLEAFDPDPSQLYLHVDLDSLDPSVGQANEFSAPDVLSLERALMLQREAIESFEPVCAAVTAYTRTSTAMRKGVARGIDRPA